MFRNVYKIITGSKRYFSLTCLNKEKHSCKLLVVGGGSGGCSTAAKFSKVLKKNELIILEPSENHYYQPLFTLVGGGTATLEQSRRNEKDVLPRNCTWIKDKAVEYNPEKCTVTTGKGDIIEYEYLLIAVGLELRYDLIPGVLEALERPTEVCSIYSPKYASHTFDVLKKLDFGNALFTFPNSSVKCPGAPQKICYITDYYLRKQNRRKNVKINYHTSLGVIFGVKKYADALWKVCANRGIKVNLRSNLVRVDADKKMAVFENLDNPNKQYTLEYSMLHVTPPMSTPLSLNTNKKITTDTGMANVDKYTLQHVKFENIFAIGDCSSTPNSKTAAAAAVQSGVIYDNLSALMKGQPLSAAYNGYASCPLVTGDKCILAEFDYDLNPLETFPFSQDRELASMYFLKKNLMPQLYWHLMLNGYWNGPALFRKILHFDLSNNKTQKLHT